MAEIITLNISDDFTKKIKEADSEIKKLVTTTEDAKNKIIQSFKDMGTLGVDEFIKKIRLAQTALRELQGKDAKMPSMGMFPKEAAEAADAANKLIKALLQLSQANLWRIAKNKELQEMHAILNARRKEALEYKRQQNEMRRLDNEAKQRKRDLTQQDKDNANSAKITAQRRRTATEAEVQALRREQSQLKLNEATFKNYASAMMMSEVTSNSRIKKIARLKTVLMEMQREEHKYGAEIEMTKKKIQALERENIRVEQSVKRIKKSKRNLMDTVGQLQRSLALLFSVSQLVGYFKKMVDIRKEMELQQKSMQILLQNKDEADKLWNQVIDLAVKSPFRVKELVTYTKQLAAYRIESDQLFDTTKRLSDVSAGLGVDMQRLILAYGQIRAAGFLRGTELRQLTEAGIPMLDELAKYLSEVEGRAISTGDVFEMISKRMISFEEVAEVFKRMTNEGGVFFNMQEEQSKTLAGQISNLHDSIDLMLNDMGRYYDSELKGGVQTLREFVANWQEVAAAIKFVLTLSSPFLTFWALSRIATSGLATSLITLIKKSTVLNDVFRRVSANIYLWAKQMGVQIKQLTGLSKIFTKNLGLSAAAARGLTTILGGLATLGVGALVAGISYGIVKLYLSMTRASREAKELKRNLTNILREDYSNLDKQADGYENLVSRLEMANEGSKERRDIISKLNSEYGEYLDFVVDEKTTIDELAKSYDDVIKRMKEKTALATFEKGLQAINDSYGRQLEDATESFYDLFEGASIQKHGDDWGLSSIVPTKKEIDDIFNLVQQRIKEADKESIDSLQEQSDLLQQIIADYYGQDFYLSRDYMKGVDLIDIMVKRKEEEENLQKRINQQYKETLKSKEANLAFDKLQNEYLLKQKQIGETEGLSDFEVKKRLNEAAQKFELDKIELKLAFGEISQKEADAAKDRIINWASDTVVAVNEKIRKELSSMYSEEQYSQILITQEEYAKGMSEIIKNTKEGWELANQLLMEQVSLKSAGLPYDEATLKKSQMQEELYRRRAKYLGIELDYIKKIDKESVDSINAKLPDKYKITIEDSYKSLNQLQEQANKNRQEAIALEAALNQQRNLGIKINEEELKQIQDDIKYYTLLWEYLGGSEKKSDTGGTNSLYDERIKVIDDMNKKYKELNKTLSKSEAMQGAFEAYIDAFADAYKGVKWVPSNVREMTPQEFVSKILNFPNENDLIRFLDELSKEPMKTFEKIKVELAKGEYVYDIKVRAKVEDDKALVDQIEEMFSGYELSLELEKLNIPPDLAKRLFGVDSLTLPQLKDKVTSMEAQFVGTDMEGEYRKFLKKISEMEDKEQVERLKKFAKFLSDTADEVAKVQNKGVLDINYAKELFVDGKLTAEEYVQAIKSIIAEVNSEVSKINLEKFKDSAEYIAAMGDMAGYTVKELEKLSHEIQELINKNANSMSPEEIKAYNDALEKINKRTQEIKSPFGKNWIQEIQEIRSLEKDLSAEKDKQNALNAILEQQTARLLELQQKLADLKNKPQTEEVKTEISNTVTEIQETQQGIADTNGQLNTTAGNISNIGGKLQTLLQGMGSSIAIVDKIVKGISQGIEATIQLFNDVKTMMDSFGVDTESGAWQDFSIAMETLGTMNQKATQGWADLKSGNIAGAVANAVGVVTTLITGLNKIHDAKYERKIQREIRFIEELEKAYEKLEKQIDDAYTIDTLKRSYDNANRNLKEQIDARERMIQQEEDKKDTDNDRIKEWQQEVEDLREQQKELLKSQVEELGGGYDYKSMTEDFVNAWVEAYEEAGDGLKGLEDNFNEFFKNIAIKQAVMGGASKILEPFLNSVNKALEDDFKVDDSEMATIDKLGEEAMANLDEFLKQWYGRWGEYMSEGEGEMSGLQRGIQGITESTAQIIEAYLNSIRFFISQQNTYLAQIASNLSSSEMENPMVSHLRIIAQQTTAINTLLNSLTSAGHSMGGRGIRVFIS